MGSGRMRCIELGQFQMRHSPRLHMRQARHWLDRDDAKNVLRAMRLAHGEVLAGAEDMVGEVRNGLVVFPAGTVGEGPAMLAGAHDLAYGIAFAIPESVQRAKLGRLVLGGLVEPSRRIERQDENIAVPRAPFRIIMAAGEFQAHAAPCRFGFRFRFHCCLR